jgi:hypothetical protein
LPAVWRHDEETGAITVRATTLARPRSASMRTTRSFEDDEQDGADKSFN